MCGIGALFTPACSDAACPACTRRRNEALHRLRRVLRHRGPDAVGAFSAHGLDLLGAVLHMQGAGLCAQPLVLDGGEAALAFNGEVYSGLDIAPGSSDTAAFGELCATALAGAADPSAAACALASALAAHVAGPWAFLLWQPRLRTLYFGRDPFGRRSLLVSAPDAPATFIASTAIDVGGLPDGCGGSLPLSGGWTRFEAPAGGDGGEEGSGGGGGGEDSSTPTASPAAASAPSALALRFPVVEVPPAGIYYLTLPEDAAVGDECSNDAISRGPELAPPHVVHVWGRRRGEGEGQRLVVRLAPWTSHAKGTSSSSPVLPLHANLLAAFPATVTGVPVGLPLGTDGVRPVSPADAAAASLELLRRLSRAVQRRVTLAVAPTVSDASSSSPPPPWHQIAFLAPASSPPPVSGALQALGRGMDARRSADDDGWVDLPSDARAWAHAALQDGGLPLTSSAPSSSGARVAVLFSGGLDSMTLALLAHHHCPPEEPIDLINVCFAPDHQSPDRLAAIAGLGELRALAPARRWQFVAVDEAFSAVMANQARMGALLTPAATAMDFNIGSALWFAARGVGYVDLEVRVGEGGVELAEGTPRGAAPATTAAGASSKKTRRPAGGHSSKAAAQDPPLPDAASPATTTTNASADPLLRYGTGSGSSNPHDDVLAALAPETAGAVVAEALSGAPALPRVAVLTPLPDRLRAAADTVVAGIDATTPPPAPVLAPDASGEPDAGAAAAKPPKPGKAPPATCFGLGAGGLRCSESPTPGCAGKYCAGCCARSVSGASGGAGVTAPCRVHAVATSPADEGSTPPLTSLAEAVLAAPPSPTPLRLRVLVRSSAKLLLSGIGADEQMGGYGRHRSTFYKSGWAGLAGEMALDVARLWRRNLGRDDRVCSDHGREVRLPFLDEDVAALLRTLPLPLLTDPRLGGGVGDKRVLRVAARAAGLDGSTRLVKRAIHFGSRIAKAFNLAVCGSNSAGKGGAVFDFTLDAPPALLQVEEAKGE